MEGAFDFEVVEYALDDAMGRHDGAFRCWSSAGRAGFAGLLLMAQGFEEAVSAEDVVAP